MDLALARRVETRLVARRQARRRTASSSSCRPAASPRSGCSRTTSRARWTITVAGRGSTLIGGALRDEITRAEVEELVLDGFFPRVDAAAAPPKRARRHPGVRPALRRRSGDHAPPGGLLCKLHGAQPDGDAVERRRAQVGGDPRAHPRGARRAGCGADAARAGERRARSGGRARRRLLRAGAPRPRACASPAARRARTTSASTPRRSRPGRSTVLCLTPRGFEEGAAVALERARARAAHQSAGALPPVLVVGSRGRSSRASS